MTTSTIRRTLDREENQIKDDILRMGSLVETAIERAVTALKQRDGALAQQIRRIDWQETAGEIGKGALPGCQMIDGEHGMGLATTEGRL